MTRLAAPSIPLTLALLGLPASGWAQLPEDTIRGWDEYVARTEARIDAELRDGERFLVMEFFDPSRRAACEDEIRRGDVCIEKLETKSLESKPIEVPGGMVHHWYGSIFLRGVKLPAVLDWVATYDHREDYYSDVLASRLLSHDGDEYDIYLRLVRKKIITATFDTEHHVVYSHNGEGKASSKSVATKIREVDNAGTPRETELPPGKDRGFLWRLNSYWRFEQREDGTVVECESLSLSRSIPGAVEWMARRFIESVPRESLESALLPIQKNVKPEAPAAAK